MPKIAVVGTTTWGTTLAILLARKGYNVRLLAKDKEEAFVIENDNQNRRRLRGVEFPPSLEVSSVPSFVLGSARMVILAVPAQTMRQNAKIASPYWEEETLVVSAAKGIEIKTLSLMSQVIADEFPAEAGSSICALSGPNIAWEIARGHIALSTVANADEAMAIKAQEILDTNQFRVYTNPDIIGVQMAGALKNIIALGAGMADGLGAGDNAKAAFITRGLAEITRLGLKMGALPLTFAGLSGLGDLITTCYSRHSRNRRAGEWLARGRSLKQIEFELGGHVIEGIPTTMAASQMASRHGVEMPITQGIRRILSGEVTIEEAVVELMERLPTSEKLASVY